MACRHVSAAETAPARQQVGGGFTSRSASFTTHVQASPPKNSSFGRAVKCRKSSNRQAPLGRRRLILQSKAAGQSPWEAVTCHRFRWDVKDSRHVLSMLQNCVESADEIGQMPGRDGSEGSLVTDPESHCAPARGSLELSCAGKPVLQSSTP